MKNNVCNGENSKEKEERKEREGRKEKEREREREREAQGWLLRDCQYTHYLHK
jgi:hypothetical protein